MERRGPAPAGATQVDLLRELARGYARGNARTGEVRSVAVVGNAPLPPSEARAQAIDGCDLVLRVNGLALDTDERPAAVGRRADVVVLNRGVLATPWLFRDYRARLYLLVEPGRLHWEPEIVPDWWPADLGLVFVSNRDVVLPLSEELGLDSLADGRWATTGTLAAWLARVLFPDAAVLLAGYSMLDDPGQTSWPHAWGRPSDIGPEHALAREGELLRSWADAGTVTIHR